MQMTSSGPMLVSATWLPSTCARFSTGPAVVSVRRTGADPAASGEGTHAHLRCRWTRERPWPTAVPVDHLVDLAHDSCRFRESGDDILVMGDVVLRSVRPLRSLSHFSQTLYPPTW